MTQEYRAEFRGKSSFWTGWIREENGTLFARVPHKAFPFIKKWKPLISNVKEHTNNYSERRIMDLQYGLSNKTVRCFPFDIHTFEPYYPDMNPEMVRELESLRISQDFLFQYCKELEETMESHGMTDIVEKKFKAKHEFMMGLKPPSFVTQKPKEKRTK